jgi:protein-S-isoprenylcysteine O-methyltransferase Ste14
MRSQSKKQLGKIVRSLSTNLFLFSLAIFVYRTNQYYTDFLRSDTQQTLLWMLGLYALIGIPVEMLLPASRRRTEGKGIITMRTIARWIRTGASHSLSIEKEEKNAMLFLLVKFFFLPVMINFLYGNWETVTGSWSTISGAENFHQLLLHSIFPLLVALFFLIDTAYFVFGYTVEYPLLNTTVRSVEPTMLGWIVALLCYPPFNRVMDNYFIWPADSNAQMYTLLATYALQLSALGLLFVYLWATLALGTRASNLTNRGIVTWGPYAYVRHPAYSGKVLGWWITSIPFMMISGQFFLGVFSMVGWTVIYFLRAITEERHLSADPDYREYCKKVQWRFIPCML